MHLVARVLSVLVVVPVATALLIAAPTSVVAALAPKVTIVASGLESPRSVVFIGQRAVVSESGTGGPDCFMTFLGNTCVGKTSQVSWVDTATGIHTVLAGGFFSQKTGGNVIGISGMALMHDNLYAQIGSTSREVPAAIAAGHQGGDLVVINPNNGTWSTVTKVGDSDFDFTLQFTQPTPGGKLVKIDLLHDENGGNNQND
jgi:hypothetical protein